MFHLSYCQYIDKITPVALVWIWSFWLPVLNWNILEKRMLVLSICILLLCSLTSSVTCSFYLPFLHAKLDLWTFLWRINLQVYSSLAPIIHIVNVGTASKESYANVTVSSHQDLPFCRKNGIFFSVEIVPPLSYFMVIIFWYLQYYGNILLYDFRHFKFTLWFNRSTADLIFT